MALVRDVLGHIGYRATVFPPRQSPWTHSQTEQNEGRGKANQHPNERRPLAPALASRIDHAFMSGVTVTFP